jgi:NAD(P)H-dependent FMN reductase
MSKPTLSILSSSIRPERKSHRVALYFESYINQHNLADVEILDLREFQFPLFKNRLSVQKQPEDTLLDFSSKIQKSDGIIIVTPEYTGGIPAALTNAIDVLYDEWQKKPIAISTVSSGQLGGSNCLESLQFTLWKIGALMTFKTFPVSKIEEKYGEDGTPINKSESDSLANVFVKDLMAMIAQKDTTGKEFPPY